MILLSLTSIVMDNHILLTKMCLLDWSDNGGILLQSHLIML